jgi:hypothetical protein
MDGLGELLALRMVLLMRNNTRHFRREGFTVNRHGEVGWVRLLWAVLHIVAAAERAEHMHQRVYGNPLFVDSALSMIPVVY